VARIRSVKPEYWADEEIAELPRDARLLLIGLWNLADEHGRLRGDARYVKGQLLPYDDDLSASDVDKLLDLIGATGRLVRYQAGSRSYVYLPTLAQDQRLEPDKVPSKLPAPPDLSASAPRTDEPAPDSDEPESRTEDHALLYGSGSMEPVAAAAREPDPDETIVAAFAECTPAEAAAVIDRVKREKRPTNLRGLLRTIGQAGEMPGLVAEVRKVAAKADAAAVIAALRDGPPCPHGDPGGDQLHPIAGTPLCPACRKARSRADP
jgi:hypothetical protein